MKLKQLVLPLFLIASVQCFSQANINSWHLNTTGSKGKYWDLPGPSLINMTDSSGVIRLCYTSTHVYVKTKALAGNYIMGPSQNPNDPVAATYTFKFPKNPTQQTGTKTAVPPGGPVGLALNGVLLYGNRSADSYNTSTNTNTMGGSNVWHCDAWYNEKTTMDTSGNGHSDPSGKYHYHANPSRLYTDPSTDHSPIVGYAIDGYPIYGPFGYSVPTNSGSSIKRMASSYQLRSITTRTTLPNGTTASSAGPNVSTQFPLGMYVEDYSYVNGSGDLDDLNGRYCVTPEYPSGTYAYFLTTDNTGTPAYPYIFASSYYGVISSSDTGPNLGNATIPSAGTTCVTAVTGINDMTEILTGISFYPNPASEKITFRISNDYLNYVVINITGKQILTGRINGGEQELDIHMLEKGFYFILFTDQNNNSEALRFIKN